MIAVFNFSGGLEPIFESKFEDLKFELMIFQPGKMFLTPSGCFAYKMFF